MPCSYCNMQIHTQCLAPLESVCCCPQQTPEATLNESPASSITITADALVNYTDEDKPKRGRPQKDGADMLDQKSTGRKRAVEEYPIMEGEICAWRGLRYAGGGVIPIIGCSGDDAKHVHHGPDKSTLNNAIGTNLHHVCHLCHNRWHTLNNEFYGERPDGGEPFLPVGNNCEPHDSETKASDLEIQAHDQWWRTPAKHRPLYTLVFGQNKTAS